MAKIGPLRDAVVMVNGVNISTYVNEVTIETTRPEIDVTGMGAVNTETQLGVGDATITCTALLDFTTLDPLLWPLSQTNTPFTVTVKPTSAAVSVSNPLYSMQSLLPGYSPIAGGPGSAATTSLVFRNAAQAGLTRATV